MNKFLATLLIGLSLISFPIWSADFDKGVAAAESGDFAVVKPDVMECTLIKFSRVTQKKEKFLNIESGSSTQLIFQKDVGVWFMNREFKLRPRFDGSYGDIRYFEASGYQKPNNSDAIISNYPLDANLFLRMEGKKLFFQRVYHGAYEGYIYECE